MIDRTEEGLEAITAKIDELEALLVKLNEQRREIINYLGVNKPPKEENQDEIIYDGVTYIAAHSGQSCDDCAFFSGDVPMCTSSKCESSDRRDGRNVIFVEKQK